MQTDALAERLIRLGLTSYEARAYVALTRRESYTAAQVSRQAALPRQRIYDVLGSLVAKGLATTRPGTVVKYAATAPDLAVERLIEVHRAELVDLERQAHETVAELTPGFKAGQSHTDPLEFIELLRDRGAINERFAELQASVQREILVFTRPPYATPPQENVEGIKVSRTHVARSIYEFSIFNDRAATAGVQRFLEAGEEARVVDHLPLKLVIIDESIVMIGMRDPVAGTPDLTIMVVEHPELASILKTGFEAIWATGFTFEEAYDRYVTQRDRIA
ncbi:MAG: HTH-type transcriptional regulator, sugar sensing transcriptional regulator [Chloroflexota bacterium]|nr:HTH-type transcriptional regulator, sugar sensing transcriptional regulator [Chloroflexota bacterium]